MANPVEFTVETAVLPSTFEGTLADFVALLPTLLTVRPDQEWTSFVVGTTMPTSNVGPWLKVTATGGEWWVWSTTDSTYVSLTVKLPDIPDNSIPATVLVDGTLAESKFDATLAAKLNAIRVGTSAQRPLTPSEGYQYFDTTIHVHLVYERSAWRTASGSPGDTKHVKATSLAEALNKNPGWVEDTDAAGVVTAGPTETHPYGTKVGTETVSLTSDQNGPHTHTTGLVSDPDGGDYNASGSDTDKVKTGTGTSITTSSSGTGAAHSNMQPTRFLWTLVKE